MVVVEEVLDVVDGGGDGGGGVFAVGEGGGDGGGEGAAGAVDASGEVGAGVGEVVELAVVPEDVEAVGFAFEVSAFEEAGDVVLFADGAGGVRWRGRRVRGRVWF